MNRRGAFGEEIKGWVLVLAFLAVGLSTVPLLGKTVDDSFSKHNCARSIAASDSVATASNDVITNIQLDCPAPCDDIQGHDDYQSMNQIAGHFRDCWYKTGSGLRRNAFDAGVFGFGTSSHLCFVCSEFTVSREHSVDDLIEFMQETKYNAIHDVTYEEYLSLSPLVEEKITLWNDEKALRLSFTHIEKEGFEPKNEDGQPRYIVLYELFGDENQISHTPEFKSLVEEFEIADEEKVPFLSVIRESDIFSLGCINYHKETGGYGCE